MENYIVLISTSFLLLTFVSTTRIDYSGNLLVRAIPETPEQLELLWNWKSTNTVDFWVLPSTVQQIADIRVNSETYSVVTKTLTDFKISHNIIIADLGQLEKQEKQTITLRRALYNGKNAIDVENYHTYEEVMAYLTDLANTNPLVSIKIGGASEESRDIIQVIISSDLSANKPVHFFDCNIHAREWITCATCIWILDQIANGYGSDPEITAFVDQYDWKFVPIANPDGYAYTWSTDRNWRKTRKINNNSTCIGVDANRNFLVGFGGSAGSSSDPCSETYHGAAAFSERESSALRDLIAGDNGKVKTAFSIHSYGQLWVSPYGYTSQLPADYFEMIRVMGIGVGALSNTYGTRYIYGTTASAIYISSGDTIDYYYDIEGIVHSYTIELRDVGAYGFMLPPDQIVPTAIETWNGIKALIRAI